MHNGKDRSDTRTDERLHQGRSSLVVNGLTSEEARQQLAAFGPNAVADEAPPRWQNFLAKFWAPIPWMLEAAVVLQVGMGSAAGST
jgi:H+-transporting ATPase